MFTWIRLVPPYKFLRSNDSQAKLSLDSSHTNSLRNILKTLRCVCRCWEQTGNCFLPLTRWRLIMSVDERWTKEASWKRNESRNKLSPLAPLKSHVAHFLHLFTSKQPLSVLLSPAGWVLIFCVLSQVRCYHGSGKCRGGVRYLCHVWLDFSGEWTMFSLPLGATDDTKQCVRAHCHSISLERYCGYTSKIYHGFTRVKM